MPRVWVDDDQEARVASAPWTVTRHDHEVRIDLTEAASLGQAETQAIIDALEGHLDEDGVTTIRLDGPALDVVHLPDGFATLVARLTGLGERQGMRFYVGPI